VRVQLGESRDQELAGQVDDRRTGLDPDQAGRADLGDPAAGDEHGQVALWVVAFRVDHGHVGQGQVCHGAKLKPTRTFVQDVCLKLVIH
jgi:hypothetical protein